MLFAPREREKCDISHSVDLLRTMCVEGQQKLDFSLPNGKQTDSNLSANN